MHNMPQTWFEVPEIKKRFYDKSVWIPLREMKCMLREGKMGRLGYKEEFLGVGSIAVPLPQRTEAEKIDWNEIGLRASNPGYVEDGEYLPSNVYRNTSETVIAEHLVLERRGNSAECSEWHLNQDILITLGLKREVDTWVAISYGYEEVARMERDKKGCPVSLSIKASYLKDYLCARRMALYMTSHRSRVQIVKDSSHIKWKTNPNIERDKIDRWEGRVTEIHEGGERFGSGFAVFHVARTDIDYEADIPEFGLPNDENVTSKQWTGDFKGEKLYRIQGELWRCEWVEPAEHSYIVCGEEAEPTSFFITDNSGTVESKKTLDSGSRWLWFKPSVVNAILKIRGSFLGWYTRDTGNIGCSPGDGVHFGVNQLGFLNVYAKDIGLLPDWQQKIWAGHNIAPEGKVCAELLMSQMEAHPASTQAPEDYLTKGIELMNKLTLKEFGISVINEHSDTTQILRGTHRFRAINREGLFELAKNLYKLTGERMDSGKIKGVVKPNKNDPWGPLKSLEKLLALKIGSEEAYNLISPLWGIYNLRIADSHLSSNDLDHAYKLCGINISAPIVVQGYQLIHCCVACLYRICEALE
jgi:hypothetical protein